MGVVLSIDIGTTNIKVGIVDASGQLLATTTEKICIERPENRAAEHNPKQLIDTLIRLSASITPKFKNEISTIVVSTYQFGMLLLDKNRTPLTGITTLLDTRARVTFEQFKEVFDSTSVYARTGCPPFTQYPLARLFYFQQKNPELFSKIAHVLSCKAFVLSQLTGIDITDPSTEAASQLMNIQSIDWDDELLAQLSLPRDCFPRIADARSKRLPLLPDIASALGVTSNTRVIPGLYDGGALAVGLGGLQEDTGVINIGTSGMLRVLTRTPVLDTPERMAIQTYYLMDGLYFAGGAVNNATVPLNWLKDQLIEGEYQEFMEEARTAPLGSRKVFFLPYFTGERDWQIGTVASGVLFGLREYHSRAEILRSALEGVAYCLNGIKQALADTQIPIRKITIGGGGVRHPLWCEILANVLDLPLQKTKSDIACLVGNGILGFVSEGTFATCEEATAAMVTAGETFEPVPEAVDAYRKYYNFYMKLFSGFRDLYKEHAELDRV